MIYNIESKLQKKGKDVKSDLIGELVSRELKKLDKVAYIRFASVYRDFSDVDDFKLAIASLSPQKSGKSKDFRGFRKEIRELVK